MGNTAEHAKKIKVLFLLEAFDKGGIEKVTLDIVNNLDPERYDITVQTFWYRGHCQSQVNDNITVRPFFFKKYVKGIIRLIQYLPPKLLYMLFVKGKYDVEIAASDGGAAKVISGSTNDHSKKICWVHMDVIARGSKLKEYRNRKTAKKIYEKFDKIVCVSASCLDKFKEKFGNIYNTAVVYNPINEIEITKKAEEFFSYPNNRNVNFVCVGRLVEQKGFDRLIDACERIVCDGYKDFSINIVGTGPCEAALKTLVSEKKLYDFISFHGFKENPYPYIKNADVFLLPSRDEAFPLAVGESLIIGTPVISTECSGIREWLGCSQEYGYITENSTDGIYEGIKFALSDLSRLKQMAKNTKIKKDELDFFSSLKTFEDVVINVE